MAENIWDKFDREIDTVALAREVAELEANGETGYRDVPHGTYEVEIKKLELTASKKGDAMVKCQMKILDGEYKGSSIFMNQVVMQRFQIHIVNDFLRSLVEQIEDGEKPEIIFKNYNQYNDMIMDVMDTIDGNFEYLVDYRENSKNPQYSEFKIKEVYILED